MSASQQIALALHKERLVVRAGQQREQLAQYGEPLKKICAAGDKLIGAVHYAKAHPWTVGVAVGAAVIIGRRHWFRAAGYAWSAWRVWRFASTWVRESDLINRFKNK